MTASDAIRLLRQAGWRVWPTADSVLGTYRVKPPGGEARTVTRTELLKLARQTQKEQQKSDAGR